MANYQELKNAVAEVIKTNGNQEITGQVLQNTLLTIISTIGANRKFAGLANPQTTPGTPDANIYYIATQEGNYVNFSQKVYENETCILYNSENGRWKKLLIEVVSNQTLGNFLQYPCSTFVGRMTNAGTINTNPEFTSRRTGKISCKNGDIFYYKGYAYGDSVSVLFYDEQGQVISTSAFDGRNVLKKITVDVPNCVFIEFFSIGSATVNLVLDVYKDGSKGYEIAKNTLIWALDSNFYERVDNVTSGSQWELFEFIFPAGKELYVSLENDDININILVTYSDGQREILIKGLNKASGEVLAVPEKDIVSMGYFSPTATTLNIKMRGIPGSVKKNKQNIESLLLSQAKLLGVEDAFISNVAYKNLYNIDDVVLRKEVYNDGSIETEANSCYIKIKVYPIINNKITISGFPNPVSTNTYRFWSIWDINETPLLNGRWEQNNANQTITLPNDATYILFSPYQREGEIKPDITKIQVEYGSEATEYVEGLQLTDSLIIEKNGKTHRIPQEIESKRIINLLVFGDSITETDTFTYNEDLGNPYTKTINRWVRSNWLKWVNLTSNANYELGEIRNYAKSGASFRDRKSDDRQYLGFQIEEMIADLNPPEDGVYYGKTFVPDIVIVAIGTNDGGTSTTYEEAMAKTVMTADDSHIDVDATLANLDVKNSLSEAVRYSFMKLHKQFPNAIFFYVTPIQINSNETPTSLLEVTTQLAKRYNFIVIDCNSESGIVRDFQTPTGESGDLYDGLHPNEIGQKKMARCIMNKVITNILY